MDVGNQAPDILDVIPAQSLWPVWEEIGNYLSATELQALRNAHPTLSSCRTRTVRCPYCKDRHGPYHLIPLTRKCACGYTFTMVCPGCHHSPLVDGGDAQVVTDFDPVCRDCKLHKDVMDVFGGTNWP